MSQKLDAQTRAELEEERRFLLDSLRDLEREREAGDVDDDDYATLRDDYTARAASVLRALEVEAPRPSEPKPAPVVRSGRARRWTRARALTVAVIAAVAVGSGVSMAAFSGQRVADTPAAAPEPPSSETAQHLMNAQRLESEEKPVEALKEYDKAIEADRTNVVALTYRGWLLARAGLTDPAMASLDQALAVNPGFPDAHFFRGMVLYQGRNDPAAAVTEFETYLASNPPPEAAAAVKGVLERARNDIAATASTTPPPPPG